MTTFVNNDVASGATIFASDHNEQGSRIAGVLNGNVDSGNLSDSAATTSKIADAAVTTPKLQDGAVTSSKIDWTTVGVWQSWTPTLTGFSSDPSSAVYRYRRIGNTVDISWDQPINGTSNSTQFTISLPFTASNVMQWQASSVQSVNNGSVNITNAGLISIPPSSSVAVLYKDVGGNPWTASGGKRQPTGFITYECIP